MGLVRSLLAERWHGDTDRAAAAAAAVGAVNVKRADAELLLHRLAAPPSRSPESRSSGAEPGIGHCADDLVPAPLAAVGPGGRARRRRACPTWPP